MSRFFDFIVIGGGAAGTSVAYELSLRGRRVALLEQETAPGYHSTSRSAAALSENYGSVGWQLLSSASRAFFTNPPAGFAEHPLLRPLGALYLAAPGNEEVELDRAAAELLRRGVRHEAMVAADALKLCPVLRIEGYSRALYEPGCADIDAHALLQGYLRLAKRNGAQIFLDSEARSIVRNKGVWSVATSQVTFSAPSLVNAAGAWADVVAERAGLRALGLTPYRRTAITFDPPPTESISEWPMTFDVAETWYFKPEAGRIIVSPADKSPSPPCDCMPEEYDVAVAADRIEKATTMRVERIHRRWAGLRTFAADNQPVIGADPDEPSFIWLAGQGGNGVMAAPAAAQLAAALTLGEEIPSAVGRFGVTPELTTPARLLEPEVGRESAPAGRGPPPDGDR
jgi:D-arginine dehydrogenase